MSVLTKLKQLFKKKQCNITGKIIEHNYEHTPFSIVAEECSHGKGYWTTWKVTVKKYNKVIGGYTRGYHGYVETTFHPFMIDNEWYALYSDDYTTTKVARLKNKFEPWCGEEGHSFGFCPVEFYVPRFFKIISTTGTTENKTPFEYYSQYYSINNVGFKYTSYGFLSGCIWGDDSSWKVKFIDLSEIHNKKLIIDDRFGYCELADSLSLKESVDIDEPDSSEIRIAHTEYFSLKHNKFVRYNENDENEN